MNTDTAFLVITIAAVAAGLTQAMITAWLTQWVLKANPRPANPIVPTALPLEARFVVCGISPISANAAEVDGTFEHDGKIIRVSAVVTTKELRMVQRLLNHALSVKPLNPESET